MKDVLQEWPIRTIPLRADDPKRRPPVPADVWEQRQGGRHIATARDLAPLLTMLTNDALFEDVCERTGLSKQDGALVTIAALLALNRANDTAAWAKHLTDDNVTVDELVKVIGPLASPDRPSCSVPPRGSSEQWFEELSKTEVRVLRFLPTNMTAPEIAQELYLSIHTVKMHIRHIYSKLGVHRRGEAVKRASTLGLLRPSLRAAPIPA